jgi:hypothetical protein
MNIKPPAILEVRDENGELLSILHGNNLEYVGEVMKSGIAHYAVLYFNDFTIEKDIIQETNLKISFMDIVKFICFIKPKRICDINDCIIFNVKNLTKGDSIHLNAKFMFKKG